MKRVLALLYFGVLAMGSIYAQGIEFFHGTYEEALQKARAEGKQIFVDVYTSWCGPCKMLSPVLHEIAEEYADTLKVGKVNVDEQMELAMRFQVSSIPMVVLFKNGKAVAKSVGYRPKAQLLAMVQGA